MLWSEHCTSIPCTLLRVVEIDCHMYRCSIIHIQPDMYQTALLRSERVSWGRLELNHTSTFNSRKSKERQISYVYRSFWDGMWLKIVVLFYSKVSNEPWKLKPGTSKSMRRPTSAKKLQPLSEETIMMAARVSTLRQVASSVHSNTLATVWSVLVFKTFKMKDALL